MLRLLTFLFIIISFSFASERSMFGAGDLDSPQPYGLTSTEKVIVNNKKALNQNEKRIKKVDSQLTELSERIDGIESIFEGDGQKLNSVYKNFNNHIEEYKTVKGEIEAFELQTQEQIKNLKGRLDQIELKIESNGENIRLLKNSFDKIVKLVNDINSKYVTKKEFNSLIKVLDNKKSKPKAKAVKSDDILSRPKKELMAEARRLFKKDYFTKAIPILEHLIASKYRPAECNYLMGEIKYYRKKYSDALGYYKTSMMLYDKAKYLPRLLLHSAISFEKTGDKSNAENFYSTLIEVYPSSKEAKEASKRLNN